MLYRKNKIKKIIKKIKKMKSSINLKKIRTYCPACNSIYIVNDYHSPWVYIFVVLLFPIGLLFLAVENRNKKCGHCGVRFQI